MQDNADVQKKLKKKRNSELLTYFSELVRKEGLGPTLRRTTMYLKRRFGNKKRRFLPKKRVLKMQQATDTSGWPTISICVPVYNANPQFFEQLLDSVMKQSYAGWELCLADASDDKNLVKNLVSLKADKRIKLVTIENLGIALNTNAAAKMASGDYISLLDHDDLIGPSAVYEFAKIARETQSDFIYSDEALFTSTMANAGVGHFKPDFSPQYLLNVNYVTHMVAVRRSIFEQIGGFQRGFDGSQDHDLILRVTEHTDKIYHIPKVLYFWRQHAGSTSTGVAAKPYVEESAIRAIDQHLRRAGINARAVKGKFPSTYKVDYAIENEPLVTIVIPNHEHVEELSLCLKSIYKKSSYNNFEVVIVENNSKKDETFKFYEIATKKYPNCRVEICKLESGFNFPAICNFGRGKASGSYLLFLNNDVEVISEKWIEEMLQLCVQPKVGAVGALLYYPDNTVQHAGVIVGLGGRAGHSHKYALRGRSGYMFRQACVQELSSVTAACMMCDADAFDSIGGFDTEFAVAFNDVDFCLRLGQAGYKVLFTPYAELYHHESKSRGLDEEGDAKNRFEKERALLSQRWGASLLKDPFYSPNLTLDREDFTENNVLPEV